MKLEKLLSRPLEFRVWHMPTQKMWPVHSICFETCEVTPRLPESATVDEWNEIYSDPFKFDDCVIMQYTGRKCERGHKVFDGDVLRWDCVQHPDDLADGEEEYTAYYWIKFHRGSFIMLNMGENEPYSNDSPDLSNYTIIHQRVGNIYENPEMLELTEGYPLHPDHIPYEEAEVSEPAI